jgi:hypothetical protein
LLGGHRVGPQGIRSHGSLLRTHAQLWARNPPGKSSRLWRGQAGIIASKLEFLAAP